MGRGQSSVEYLIIVGIALGLLIPAVFLFVTYSNARASSGVASQINEVGIAMVSAATEAYALGAGARREVEVSFPEGVTRVWVSRGFELVISYDTANGPSESVFFSNIPLNISSMDATGTGNVSIAHAGLARFRFVSLGPSVNVSEVLS